jgi:hypothetical protein
MGPVGPLRKEAREGPEEAPEKSLDPFRDEKKRTKELAGKSWPIPVQGD